MLKVTTLQLTESLYKPYVAFLNAVHDYSADDLASFRHKVETNLSNPAFIVVAYEHDTLRIVADLRYVCPAADKYDPDAALYYLGEIRGVPGIPMTVDMLRSIIGECVFGANPGARVHFIARIDRDHLTDVYDEALRSCGFRTVGERVEFRTRIQDMTLVQPDERLQWRNGRDTSLEDAYQLYNRCTRETSVASRFDLKEHFLLLVEKTALRNDPEMLQVGYFGGQSASIAFLSVNAANDGWCTMLFVGIVPEHRGKGLGRAVHSHGIRVLKANGGILYHDGTESTNAAMMRVFHTQGCSECSRMMEYEYRRSPEDGADFRKSG